MDDMALALPWGAALTDDDLQGMPDDGHRYELVNGTLVVTPAPGTAHQMCVVALIALLHGAAGPEDVVLTAPFDYRVSAGTVLQPDILVARRADLSEARLERPPLLVVEVQSPSTRLGDLGTKRLAYEGAGVPAYWLADPQVPSLTVLRLDKDRYRQEAQIEGDGEYVADYPYAVTIVPARFGVQPRPA